LRRAKRHEVDTIARPATEKNIEIYSNPGAIKRAYKEIALITAEEGWSNTESDLIQRMMAKAREIGADAIVLLGGGKTTSGGAIAGNVLVMANFNTTRCSAIVYTDAR